MLRDMVIMSVNFSKGFTLRRYMSAAAKTVSDKSVKLLNAIYKSAMYTLVNDLKNEKKN